MMDLLKKMKGQKSNNVRNLTYKSHRVLSCICVMVVMTTTILGNTVYAENINAEATTSDYVEEPQVSSPVVESDSVPEENTEHKENIKVALNTEQLSVFANEEYITTSADISGGLEPYDIEYQIYRDTAFVEKSDEKVKEHSHEFKYMPTEFGNYKIKITITDQDGCVAEDDLVFQVASRENESQSQWEATLNGVVLTGNYGEDLVSIARTQVGYQESSRNFIVLSDHQIHGYTRYGAMYGIPYDPWCASFVSFCMNYAGILTSDMPQGTECVAWKNELTRYGLYENADSAANPKKGDLVFFYCPGAPNSTTGNPNHVGIISALQGEDNITGIYVIEGNSNNAVRENFYSLNDSHIVGYGLTNKAYDEKLRREGENESETETDEELETEDATENNTEIIAEEESTEQLTETETEDYTRTRYVYEDSEVKVTAILEDPMVIPDDAELLVRQVLPENGKTEYSEYLEALNKSSEVSENVSVTENPNSVFEASELEGQVEYSEDNTILYDVRFVRESIVSNRGENNQTIKQEEFEPSVGSVKITFEFKKQQLTEQLGASDASEIQLIHLPVEGEDNEEKPEIINVENVNIELLEADVALGKKESVTASTDSFSVYATTVQSGRRRTDFSTNHTFAGDGGQYTLEYMLQNFQITSFGDVELETHCLGALLVKGNLSGSGSGFADARTSEKVLVSSYINGSVQNFSGMCNTREGNADKAALFLGTANQVTDPAEGWVQYQVFGKGPYNNIAAGSPQHGNEVAITDNYIDWDQLEATMNSSSETLSSSIGRTPASSDESNDGSVLNVKAGDRIKVENISKYAVINIIGDLTQKVNTVVDIPGSGNLGVLPKMWINGSEPQVSEVGSGTAIVWNFPNAISFSTKSQNWGGHIVAPKATVNIGSGNYNGGIICKKFKTSAEGHLYPYNGGKIIPDSFEISAEKTIDGKDPETNQKFTFKLAEAQVINGQPDWENATVIETKQNNGNLVNFRAITFNSIGTHYYKVYEDIQSSDTQGFIADTTIYYLRVTVTMSYDGNNSVYKAGTEIFTNPGLNTSMTVDKICFDNKKPSSLKLIKIDGYTEQTLSGNFKFKLEDDEGNVIKTPGGSESWAIDNNGAILFENLSQGTYILSEIEHPDEYVSLPNAISFTVGSEGEITLAEQTGSYVELKKVENNQVLETPILTVKNYKYINMPQTGGDGRKMAKLLGFFIASFGTVLFLFRKRNRFCA